jgi:hypothetical protein
MTTPQEKKKLIKLITKDKLRYFDAAKKMGKGWTLPMIGKRCQAWGITNGLHGGQFIIPKEELDLQKKMLEDGLSHKDVTIAINKKFNKNYTRSAMSYRAKAYGWESKCNCSITAPRWTDSEIQIIKEIHAMDLSAMFYVRRLPGRSWDAIRKKILCLENEGKLYNSNNILITNMIKKFKIKIRR